MTAQPARDETETSSKDSPERAPVIRDVPETAGPRQWIGLAVLAVPQLLVSVDTSFVLLALPRIGEALHANASQQLWITDIYSFMLAGFLITMGTLGDRIGRRRLLIIGGTGFAAASIAAAFAASPEMLIVARALMGIAGATLAPSTLALIANMFTNAAQRGVAVGIWFVAFMGGLAVGPVLGGALLTHLWWGSVFLVGVPVMVLLAILAPLFLPEYRAPSAGRIDLTSVVLSLVAVLTVVYGLKQIAQSGWGTVPVGMLLVGVAVGVAFVARQRRLAHPLLELSLFRNRAFAAAILCLLIGTLVTGPMMLFNTQYFQLVAGLSPLAAGLWTLPSVLGSLTSFGLSPVLARRIRPAYLISGGLALSVSGAVVAAQVTPSSGILPLVIGFTLVSIGSGPLVTLSTTLVLGSVPAERAGSAASLSETAGQFGYAIGIAILGSVVTLIYRAQLAHLPASLPAAAAAGARDGLATGRTAALALADPAGATLLAAAQAAFTSAIAATAVISAIALAIVAVIAAVAFRGVPPTKSE
ncbi:MFS transporter [Lacisediminihabitans sp.]|uniref:MFS transporter n=1 Tax=Lacisediminihabitans sp. TaxID=2787631 RepID=UPI00374D12A6